ncbi:unnamed protein product [Brugia pahangi]|uniref:Protein SOGA3 n=1 Tax=Brugia pahangi TaxID=6280 RepID=A0A158PSP1_BRUPA|nr:unnamed protein product [Brugia pahangi]
MSSEASCSGFEPQIYLRERCKNCFSLRSKHDVKNDTERTAIISNNTDNNSTNQKQQQESLVTLNTTKERSREKRRSWRDKTTTVPDNGAPEHVTEGTEDDTTSYTSYKSANSKDISTEKSPESISDTKSMITAISESIQDDDRAITPVENDMNFDTTMMKAEIAHLREEVIKLKEERQKWTIRKEKCQNSNDESLVEMLEERLAEAENCIQDYRDENTVLKCELRELQECESSNDNRNEMNVKLAEKLKASESLCDELMEENESLKADIKDLQQEIEEMQDQYREEEIEEFRELQRELEQNAKNCRILQFKLRKSERMREEVDAKKQHLEAKVKDLLEASSATGNGLQTTGKQLDAIRIKELESELRIAKEVSVRLHNELENAEEKRYKLEDEVFYMKDKIRELQTQNKWREARNRAELQTKRSTTDVSNNSINSNNSKEIHDILEREADLRDQLKFAEEDLRRTQLRLQDVENENEELLRKLSRLKTVKRPPMIRSFSEGHAQMQLELAEHEMEHLSTKVERLEKKNIHLSKKIMEMEMDSKKYLENEEIVNGRAKQFEVPPEMQRDIGKLMGTISELERKNLDLSLKLKQQSELNSSIPSEKSQTELRIEKEHKRIIENELMELKRMMLQSDNQKLISMATKVELLNNQLLLVNDRCSNLHRRIVKEGSNEAAYTDSLKNKCEELERQLSEQKAKNAISCSQIDSATTDEDERRRSLSKDNSATIIAELASVMSELNNVHQLLEAHKVNIVSARGSPVKNVANVNSEPKPCSKCKENETFIESQKDEIIFYKKKNKELTNQILQTEDRWTAEIEKQRQSYENEVRILHTKLNDAQKNVIEQEHLLESRTVALAEKTRMIEERDEKCDKLKRELFIVKREIQDIEANRRSAKEFEIKYKKLESMFNLEKEKLAEERMKSKLEVTLLKKKSEETLLDLEKLRNSYVKKEKIWQEKREKLEDELAYLRKQLNKDATNDNTDSKTIVSDLNSSISIIHQSAKAPVITNHKNDDVIDLNDQIIILQKKNKELVNEISSVKRDNEDLRMELASLQQKWTKDKNDLLHKAKQEEKIRNVEFDALQQKFASRMRIMEDTNKSLHSQLVQARRDRDYHREALHTFESKVSEKQRRSENDLKQFKELEQRNIDMVNVFLFWVKQIKDLKEEVIKLNADLKLAKETHEADRALWNVEKSHIKPKKMTNLAGNTINDKQNIKITESALKSAEMVQKKYAEYQNFYAKEMERLNAKMNEILNENILKQQESERITKNLREQIKVLEISQRNLMEARDMQLGAKEFLENEVEKLQELLNLNEVHRLTRKYKLSLIIEQLEILIDSSNKSSNVGKDILNNLKAFVSQLKQMKDDECKSFPISNEKKQNKGDERSKLFTNESNEGNVLLSQTLHDGTLQSTIPTRFYSYSTLPTSSYKLTATVKHLSESNSAVEIRQLDEFITNGTQTSIKKISPFPDPPPTLILNKEMAVEYDKNGRLHYIPKSISRSVSRDRYDDNNFSSCGLNDCEEDPSVEPLHLRTNSTGTNILYDIRRVELARGSQPSVRLMAKAFETMEANASKTLPNSKRSLFGIRKSRSVETTEIGKGIGNVTKNMITSIAPSPVAVTVLGRNTSLSHIEELMGSQSPFGNISRGSRNPLKIMKTKLVERVRRSLSRSNSKKCRDNSSESGQSIKRDDEAEQKIDVLQKINRTKVFGYVFRLFFLCFILTVKKIFFFV